MGMSNRRLVALAAGSALAIAGVAEAATPKANGIYVDKKKNVTIFLAGKSSINTFNADCTPGKHSKYRFSYIWGIPISKSGKFHAKHTNAVNTPNGGTLAHAFVVTINGKFVSRKEAKGTYQLHMGKCPKVTFDAKL